jgi:hypothetical protein
VVLVSSKRRNLKYEIKNDEKESYTYDKVTGEKIAVFESLANTAQQLGLWSSNIGSYKKTKNYGGFGFKFSPRNNLRANLIYKILS